MPDNLALRILSKFFHKTIGNLKVIQIAYRFMYTFYLSDSFANSINNLVNCSLLPDFCIVSISS